MQHSDFVIGQDFYTAVGKWRCTDIGRRTISAVRWPEDDELPGMTGVGAWLQGPPYLLPEIVFDEKDMALAYRTIEEAVARSLNSCHPGFRQEDVQKLFAGKRRRLNERASGELPFASTPLMERLGRYERVVDGCVLHAHDWKDDGHTVCVFDVFSRTWGEMPLDAFLAAPVAQETDYQKFAPTPGSDATH